MAQDQALACVAGRAPWPDSQIGRELAYAAGFYEALRPAVFLSYERDIRYRCQQLTLAHDPWGTSLLPQGWVLMEVKAAGAIPLWMVRALSGQGVFQTSFSKYGTAYRDLLAAGKGGVKYA